MKNKCCLYVIIPIRFFSIMICNLLIDFLMKYVLKKNALNLKIFVCIISVVKKLLINYCIDLKHA